MRKTLTIITILTILFIGFDFTSNEIKTDAATKIKLVTHKARPTYYTHEVKGAPGTKYEIVVAKYSKPNNSYYTVSRGTGTIRSNGTTGVHTWSGAFKGPGKYIVTVHARSGAYSYDTRTFIFP